MTNEDAKIALANLMIRKAGLIRTIRHEMHKQGVVYYVGLTEILEAIEFARNSPDPDPADILDDVYTV